MFSEDESSDDDWTGELPEIKPSIRLASRRNSVASEKFDVDDDFSPPFYPKSASDRAAILDSLTSSMLFSKLVSG